MEKATGPGGCDLLTVLLPQSSLCFMGMPFLEEVKKRVRLPNVDLKDFVFSRESFSFVASAGSEIIVGQ